MTGHLLPTGPLTDGSVVLRAFTPADWTLEQQMSRDADVVRWTAFPADLDEAAARHRIAQVGQWRDAGLGTRLVVERDGSALGTAGVFVPEARVLEIFYALLPAVRGAGVATRATALLAAWARGAGYTTIGLTTYPDNAASARVATKVGFVRTGTVEREIKGITRSLLTWDFPVAAAG